MSISLEQVADSELLKRIWRQEVVKALRKMPFSNFILTPDPLHYAAYEWGLDTLVSSLAKDLKLGKYTPERGEIVRMAKGKGLSRPLCFLSTRDSLVYSTIVHLMQGQLAAKARPWVGYQRSDKGGNNTAGDIENEGDSLDWFRIWLAKQGRVLKMVDDSYVRHFVETDIANFYPSIRLEAVREHLHSQTSLEKEVVRLCIQIIDGVMPRRDYSEVSLMGLPQEQLGASREIAHSLLFHVDEEFEEEGENGYYSRFMDDILIGVGSPEDGEKCIARLQRSLETIGLYPNAAKTTVTKVDKFLEDAMVHVNGEVDRLSDEIKGFSDGIPHVIEAPERVLDEIENISSEHRLNDGFKRWWRVTRRIYTLHRTTGVTSWWQYWRADVERDPGSAPVIFEYVRSWPISKRTADDLFALSSKYGELYPNISILAAETISSMPVPDDINLWGYIFAGCLVEFSRFSSIAQRKAEAERLAASWLLAGWKFGNESQRRTLLKRIPKDADATSPIRAQALSLLANSGRLLDEWTATKPGLSWESALAAEYLRSLRGGEKDAVKVAIDLIEPQLRLAPQRFAVLPRAIPLIGIAGSSATEKFNGVAPRMLKKLESNPPRLRDHRIEKILVEWCP